LSSTVPPAVPVPVHALPDAAAMASVGVGWRQPHERALLAQRPALGFIEVHSENFFAPGGAALAALELAAERYPISLHGVGLALGSACGLDAWHLDQLAALVARVGPVRVSDHACFARAELPGHTVPVHGSDLLPVAFTQASLGLMVRHVQQVQERLKRPLLIEHLSACVRWAEQDMSEPAFFNALCRQAGCGVLLDVNNLVVNALNSGVSEPVRAACGWIDELDVSTVGEVHLAGFNDEGPLVIDDHGSLVRDGVWQVYEHAVRRLGRPVPTLVEWDTDIPSFDVLLGEAAKAACIQQRVLSQGVMA
jgi:uncharacterized protein (UPF0276 family)